MGKRKSGSPPEDSPPPVPPVHKVEVADRARRELADLPAAELERIVDGIDDLAQNPRPPGVKKLVGTKDGYRIRKGDYRILFTVDDTQRLVRVYRVDHRRDVYKKR